MFGDYKAPKTEKVPTFFQYLKTEKLSKGIEGKTRYPIDVIWLPGKFDNVTLQTHAFRYIASPEHPLYNNAVAFCKALQDEVNNIDGIPVTSKRLDLVITSIENKTIAVKENEKVIVTVKSLGDYGLRFDRA